MQWRGFAVKLTPSIPVSRKARRDRLETPYRTRQRRTYPFIGWDGEGYNANGQHRYALFGNSLGSQVQGTSLDYQDCFPLLLEAPAEAIHVIYAGTYDVTMMLRNTREAQSIMRGQWVSLGRYRLRFLRGKMLTVKDTVTGQSRTLYDVFSFFGSSFVKACGEYLDGVDEVLAQIDAMKQQRSEFTAITPEVRAYMATELRLLVDLCTTLRERLATVGIHPSKWHGPGAVASAVLKTHGIKDHLGEQSEELTTAAEAAYYGGRFEMFKRGTHLGDCYQYDIRSAYPNAMRHLPSLAGMQWRHRSTGRITVDRDFALYRIVRRNMPDGWSVPHRTQWGAIYYPEWANGWYWGVELPPGMKAVEVWEPVNAPGGESPFAFVADMYDHRAALKRAGDPAQLAVKLALNSLYGKLAQSKGSNWNGRQWQKPTYHQALWAGYITAHTRSLIGQAMRLAGDSLIAVETDAVFTTQPLDLPLGSKLGQWDETTYQGIKYIQSGVHMSYDGEQWSYKTRGVTMKRGADDRAMWDDLLAHGVIKIRQVRFGTDPRQPTFGTWYAQTRKLVLDHPGSMEKRVTYDVCAHCRIPPDWKATRKGSSRYKASLAIDYDTHLHPLVCPPIPMQVSTPYRFVWNTAHDDSMDDPTLYLEYEPETIREELA